MSIIKLNLFTVVLLVFGASCRNGNTPITQNSDAKYDFKALGVVTGDKKDGAIAEINFVDVDGRLNENLRTAVALHRAESITFSGCKLNNEGVRSAWCAASKRVN